MRRYAADKSVPVPQAKSAIRKEVTSLSFDQEPLPGVLSASIASPTSKAAEAGLKAGDVIVSVGGEEMVTAEELIRAIHSSQIGQMIEITFWRGDTQNTTEAALAEIPPPP